MAGNVLLVEDEPSVGELVRSYLARDGYRVIWVRSGEDALVELDRHQIRLVILDLGLPGMDGFDVCRAVRARSQVPILMLTARDEEPDRVVGLEVGADDYLTKPFSPRELVARMKAILRRTDPQPTKEVLSLGDVVVNLETHDVTIAGESVELTTKEFELLAYFLGNPGTLLTRDRLLDRVWGVEYPGGTRTVDVHVAQLRRKLGRPALIRTLRGSGYKAVSP
jgi:DNA-binding response OmpR family regulator